MENNKPAVQKQIDLSIDGLMAIATELIDERSRPLLLEIISRLAKVQSIERKAAQKQGKEATSAGN